MDNPLAILVLSFVALVLAAETGAYASEKRAPLTETEKNALGVVLMGALTIYAVIIGFSFNMASVRYDQRKNYEEQEANAIGTEYLRVGLLPPTEVAHTRNLLQEYLEERILFYQTRDGPDLRAVDSATARLQSALWSAVEPHGAMQPTPVTAAILTGMNDVLNTQGYTQSAWSNRIPFAAWGPIIALSLCCSVLFGFYATHKSGRLLFLSLPVILAITFFLLGDLDNPRAGVIRVEPENLENLEWQLKGE
jgi:hypothetical protein